MFSIRENRFLLRNPESFGNDPRQEILFTTHNQLTQGQEKMQKEIRAKALEQCRKQLSMDATPEQRQKTIVSLFETPGLNDDGITSIIENLYRARVISSADFASLMGSEVPLFAQRAILSMRTILFSDMGTASETENAQIFQGSLITYTNAVLAMFQRPVRNQEMFRARLTAIETCQFIAFAFRGIAPAGIAPMLQGQQNVQNTFDTYLRGMTAIAQNLSRPPQGPETEQERIWRERLQTAAASGFDTAVDSEEVEKKMRGQ